MIDQLASLDPRRLHVFAACLLLLTLAAGWMYLLKPAIADWRRADAERRAIERDVRAEATRAAPDAQTLKREVETAGEALARVAERGRAQSLMAALRSAAATGDVKLGTVTVAPESVSNGMILVSLEAEAIGPYGRLAAFLADLERRVDPHTLSLARFIAQPATGEPSLRLRVDARRPADPAESSK